MFTLVSYGGHERCIYVQGGPREFDRLFLNVFVLEGVKKKLIITDII